VTDPKRHQLEREAASLYVRSRQVLSGDAWRAWYRRYASGKVSHKQLRRELDDAEAS
jgi:hypothetical protein